MRTQLKIRTRSSFKVAVLIGLAIGVAGCQTADQDNAVLGGAAGAIIGGVSTGTLKGAAIGSAIGAGTGILIGRIANNSPYCYYKRRRGGRFIARCR